MFYSTDENRHGIAHDPFKAIVSPRPIGWIGTRSKAGQNNLSPYSFFTAVSDSPKIVMFSSGGLKDSVRNARETGVFTASMVSGDLARAMNESSVSVPHGVDEFEIAGLEARNGTLVDAPYVAAAPAVLECRVTEIIHPLTLSGARNGNHLVFGQVVGIHYDETCITNGRLDMAAIRPVGRLGYMDYAESGNVYEMLRPEPPKG